MPVTLADFRFAPCFDVAVASRIGCGPSTRAENQDNFVVIDFDGRACRLQDQQRVELEASHHALHLQLHLQLEEWVVSAVAVAEQLHAVYSPRVGWCG